MLLRKAMLELEWQKRRAAVVDDMDTNDNSMVNTLAEQLRLMDICIDDVELGFHELEKERMLEADEDEKMADRDSLCAQRILCMMGHSAGERNMLLI